MSSENVKSSNVKQSLKCTAVLILIAIFAVAIPVVLKQVLPKYVPKLDATSVAILNKLAPSGDSDADALEKKHFTIITEFDLETFNSDNKKGAQDEVLAVYKALTGDSAGTYIIQTTTYGHYPLVFWIAYDADGKITALEAEYTSSDYFLGDSATLQAFKQQIIGKSVMSLAEVKSITTTTATNSATGIVKNLELSFACFQAVVAEEA